MSINRTITAIRGILAGHWTDPVGKTGCTVIIGPGGGMTASASFAGTAPGTRESILLDPGKSVPKIHALLLAGGSAFGLAAADGVMKFLAEKGIGHPTPAALVPIVPAAVIYDLLVGDPKARPTAESGYEAAKSASDAPLPSGLVGAGIGATAGKYGGPVPSGIGTSLVEFGEVRVGAVVVVNPVGDVYSQDGKLLAGHGNLEAFLKASRPEMSAGNTVLSAVAFEAPLTKAQCRLLADSTQAAVARCIRPSHTPWDGDVSFVLATGLGPDAPLPMLAALGQEAVAQAIENAVER
ncbi:MAG: P1 family peptidase [bacterium]